jgi:hypothetical protein
VTIRISNGDETKSLIGKIAEVANHTRMALLVIDNSANEPALPDELEVIRYCAGPKMTNISIALIYVLNPLDAVAHLRLKKSDRVGEIHKDVVKAAGVKANFQPKLGPSAFKDFIRPKIVNPNGPPMQMINVGESFKTWLNFQDAEYLIITGRYLHACIRATIIDARSANFNILTASTVLRGSKASIKDEKGGYFGFAQDPNISWYAKSPASKDLATF